MSDPFPAGGYGVANWQDYQNNWRKVDTDWLQTRTILRYQTGPPASGEVGQSVYDFAADKIMLRSKAAKWINVIAAENLVVSPISAASAVEGVGLSHKSAGQGLVFAPTEIIAYQKFRTGASEVVIDNTGLAITSTGMATSKLTTNPGGLVVNTQVDAPLFLGNLIADTSVNAKALTATTGAFSSNVTITGTLGVTGLLTATAVDIAAAPSSPTRAANKAYVDAQAALQLTPGEGDARYVNLTGDTMSGTLTLDGGWLNVAPGQDTCLRLRATTPLLEWRNAAATVRFAYINATAAVMNIISDAGDISLNSGGGQVRCSDGVWANGGSRFYASSQAVILVGADPYIGFYDAGTSVDNLGGRSGYVGFTSDGYLHIYNQKTSGSIFYDTSYAHGFRCSGHDALRILDGVTIVGKTTSDIGTVGHSIWENGAQYITRANDTVGILYLNRIGSPPSGRPYQYFCRNDGGIGAIYQNGTTGVSYATSSDYRQKNIVGPITNAIERIKALLPWRVTWIDDAARGETDAFIAHELAEVVPDAVSGEKDAMMDDPVFGEGPAYQQVDYSGPVPLLTAGLQDIIARVEALEAAAPAA